MKSLAKRLPTILTTLAIIALSGLTSGCRTSSGKGESDVAGLSEPLIRDIVIESSTPSTEPASPTTLITATLLLPDDHQSTSYPLILHSHGWALSRVSVAQAEHYQSLESTEHLSHFQQLESLVTQLRTAGYAVISYNQRGFGHDINGEHGTEDGSHGMSPQFEVQDAKAVIDWAQANLNLLEKAPGNPLVGMIGASYGGAFQLMTSAEDIRINAIVPTITWFDLAQAMAPNRVLKKWWALAICSVATSPHVRLSREIALACQQVSDPDARELSDAPAAERLFFDNGLSHYMEQAGFNMPPVNALILHSSRDTFFNQNEAAAIFGALQTGRGDVRLLTHEIGHETPSQIALTSGDRATGNCGSVNTVSAAFDWLNEKLKGIPAPQLPQVCLALDNTTAIHLDEIPRASQEHGLTLPLTQVDSSHSNLNHLVNDALFIPLTTASEDFAGKVIAGIPAAWLSVDAGADNIDPSQGGAANAAGVFVGIGIRRNGELHLVNDQVQPILSSDRRTASPPELIELIGVAEALQAGDEVGLLLYGRYDLYDNPRGTRSNWGNNVALVSGTVYLPIFTPEHTDSRD